MISCIVIPTSSTVSCIAKNRPIDDIPYHTDIPCHIDTTYQH